MSALNQAGADLNFGGRRYGFWRFLTIEGDFTVTGIDNKTVFFKGDNEAGQMVATLNGSGVFDGQEVMIYNAGGEGIEYDDPPINSTGFVAGGECVHLIKFPGRWIEINKFAVL